MIKILSFTSDFLTSYHPDRLARTSSVLRGTCNWHIILTTKEYGGPWELLLLITIPLVKILRGVCVYVHGFCIADGFEYVELNCTISQSRCWSRPLSCLVLVWDLWGHVYTSRYKRLIPLAFGTQEYGVGTSLASVIEEGGRFNFYWDRGSCGNNKSWKRCSWRLLRYPNETRQHARFSIFM
jgi:hypothetical protein